MNELELFGSTLPSFAFDATDTGLGKLASSSAPRISTEGGRLTAIMDGSIVGGPLSELDIIIIGVFPDAQLTSRVYYAKQYVKGSSEPPTCYSDKGDVPSADAQTPQAASCATCPQNIAGSSSTGGRACGFYKRLAVMLPGVSGVVFELRVSSTGIFDKKIIQQDGRAWYGLFLYAQYLEIMAKKRPDVKMDMSKMVTTVSCPAGLTDGIRFAPKGWATNEDYLEVVTAISNGARDEVLYRNHIAHTPPSAFELPAPVATPVPPAPVAAPVPVATPVPPAPVATPVPVDAPVPVAAPVPQVPPAPVAAPAPVDAPVPPAPEANDALASLRARMRKQ